VSKCWRTKKWFRNDNVSHGKDCNRSRWASDTVVWTQWPCFVLVWWCCRVFLMYYVWFAFLCGFFNLLNLWKPWIGMQSSVGSKNRHPVASRAKFALLPQSSGEYNNLGFGRNQLETLNQKTAFWSNRFYILKTYPWISKVYTNLNLFMFRNLTILLWRPKFKFAFFVAFLKHFRGIYKWASLDHSLISVLQLISKALLFFTSPLGKVSSSWEKSMLTYERIFTFLGPRSPK